MRSVWRSLKETDRSVTAEKREETTDRSDLRLAGYRVCVYIQSEANWNGKEEKEVYLRLLPSAESVDHFLKNIKWELFCGSSKKEQRTYETNVMPGNITTYNNIHTYNPTPKNICFPKEKNKLLPLVSGESAPSVRNKTSGWGDVMEAGGGGGVNTN